MPYKFESPQAAGYPNIEQIVPAPARLNQLPIDPGQYAQAEDPVFGTGEFIFARANGSIRQYGLCVLTPVWDATSQIFRWDMIEAPATANLGRSLYVAQGTGAMVTGQYGWFLAAGITPVNSNASVAADTTFGIAAAGQGGANVAGRQVVNGRIITPATQTVVKAVVPSVGSQIGDTVVGVANTQGFFPGAYVAGTGIPAGAFITSVDPLNAFIVISAALTAAAAGNVTQTANNGTIFYNIAHVNRPFAQGAIT